MPKLLAMGPMSLMSTLPSGTLDIPVMSACGFQRGSPETVRARYTEASTKHIKKDKLETFPTERECLTPAILMDFSWTPYASASIFVFGGFCCHNCSAR